MRRLFVPVLLLLAAPAAAQQQPEPEWRQAREEHVLVRAGRFEPSELRLEAGRPVRLTFYNGSRVQLSLSAVRFFAQSNVRSRDRDLVSEGRLLLRPGQTRSIALVPVAGRYRMNSGSWFRRMLGMSARIVVAPGDSARR